MVMLDKRTPSTVLHQFGSIIPLTQLVIFRRLIRVLVLIYSRSLSFVVMLLYMHTNALANLDCAFLFVAITSYRHGNIKHSGFALDHTLMGPRWYAHVWLCYLIRRSLGTYSR